MEYCVNIVEFEPASQFKDMQVNESKLLMGVNVSVNRCFSPRVSPVMNW